MSRLSLCSPARLRATNIIGIISPPNSKLLDNFSNHLFNLKSSAAH